MNKVILLGHVGQAPQLKTFDGGGKVASFTLATSASWKDKQTGEKKEKTTWHNVEVSGNRADVVMGYIVKGSKILVEGEIDNQAYEKNGEKRTFSKVRLHNFEFCDARREPGQKPQNPQNPVAGQSSGDIEVPF